MILKECDVVRLKDGRTGTVLGIWSDGKAYEVEIEPPELRNDRKRRYTRSNIQSLSTY